MGKMIFSLTDDDRAALEKLRAERGLRSHAEALRSLIREAAGIAGLPEPTKIVEIVPLAHSETQPIKGAVTKPKPFKSRLKGEWKAP